MERTSQSYRHAALRQTQAGCRSVTPPRVIVSRSSNRIVPPLDGGAPMAQPREIWVPDSKTHVAAEILRKI